MSRLVAFWSPSRAGASTLLLNSAAALGPRHPGLALADLNLSSPSLALHADLLPHQRPLDACLSRLLPALSSGRLTADQLTQRMLPGPGFMLLPGMLDVVSASRMTEGHVKQVVRALLSRFDLVLADLSAPMDSIGCLPVLEMADLICLVVGPSLASRFHTRRHAIPLLQTGWKERTLLLLNRGGGIGAERIAEEIGLPVALTLPELRSMDRLLEAGQIAYQAPALRAGAARFRGAVDRLAGLLLQPVSAGAGAGTDSRGRERQHAQR